MASSHKVPSSSVGLSTRYRCCSFPSGEAWIYLALSAIIHCGYFATLATAYSIGDLGFIYPIGRGTGPVLVARLSALVISEVLNAAHFAGSELFVSDYSFWPSAAARAQDRAGFFSPC